MAHSPTIGWCREAFMIRTRRAGIIGVIIGLCLTVIAFVGWASRYQGSVLPGVPVEPFTVWVRCSRGDYLNAEIRGTSREHARKLALEKYPECIVMSVAPKRRDSEV
jgi:hypothetical protein